MTKHHTQSPRTPRTRRSLPIVAAALSAALMLPAALADDGKADKPDEPKRDQPAPGSPSLDDLLGLEEEQRDTGGEAAAQQADDQELQRRLTGEQIADAFNDALQKMSVSAELLDTRFDPGIGTQRVQEDVLARLTQLIDEARRQQSASSSSSSSSSSSQQQQQSDPGRQQQQQQQQSQAADGGQRDVDGEVQGDGPPRQETDVDVSLEETRTEWGALPQRVRDMLLQGRQERFSSLYEQLTRDYYRRLAEE